MKALFFASCCICLALSPSHTAAAEEVRPPNRNITCSYASSVDIMAPGDTLQITRTLYNGEPYPLTGLYFADNFPSDLVVVDEYVTVDGVATPFCRVGPIDGHVDPLHASYCWIIDANGAMEGIDQVIEPGSVVQLVIRLTCDQPGSYQFSTNSTVFWGDASGFFFTAEPISIVVGDATGIDDRGQPPHPMPQLVTGAYPNPFNPAVTIEYAGAELQGNRLLFSVFDQRGRLIARGAQVAGSDAGVISWRPDASVHSGVYLYRIESPHQVGSGKIMLVK